MKVLERILFIVLSGILIYAVSSSYANNPPAKFPRQSKKICVDRVILTYPNAERRNGIKITWIDEKTFTFEVVTSSYCICSKCCGRKTGITKTGYKIKQGDNIVAVDPKIIHLESVVVIDNIKHKALDTGRLIKGRKIDVLFYKYSNDKANHRCAKKYGIKKMTVTVYLKK